jgi:hypothetical protein
MHGEAATCARLLSRLREGWESSFAAEAGAGDFAAAAASSAAGDGVGGGEGSSEEEGGGRFLAELRRVSTIAGAGDGEGSRGGRGLNRNFATGRGDARRDETRGAGFSFRLRIAR